MRTMTGLRQIADRFETLQGELKAARTKVEHARQELEAGEERVTLVESELVTLRGKANRAFDEIFGSPGVSLHGPGESSPEVPGDDTAAPSALQGVDGAAPLSLVDKVALSASRPVSLEW